MRKIFVDTDLIIDYTNKKNRQLEKLLTQQESAVVELFINPVIIAEFFSDQKLEHTEKWEEAKELFKFFTHIDITSKIGYLAGEYLRKGKIQFLGDALIAATCINHDLNLATRNKKHFQKIMDLRLSDLAL